MKFIVRKLELNRAICAPIHGVAPDGTKEMYEYKSLVAKKNLEPAREEHLTGGNRVSEIPAGIYLFTQSRGTGTEDDFRAAAEAVWLESLWQSIEFKNDKILIRILSEDEGTVYQIFREIICEAFQP